jgi:small-conductance mechanosensitive channel
MKFRVSFEVTLPDQAPILAALKTEREQAQFIKNSCAHTLQRTPLEIENLEVKVETED